MYFSTNVDRAHVSPIRNIRFFPRQSVEKSFRWKQEERNWQRTLFSLWGLWIGLVQGNSRRSRPLSHEILSLSLSYISFSASFILLPSLILCYNVIYAEWTRWGEVRQRKKRSASLYASYTAFRLSLSFSLFSRSFLSRSLLFFLSVFRGSSPFNDRSRVQSSRRFFRRNPNAV